MEAKMEGQRVPQANVGNKLEQKRKKRYKQPWVLHFMVLPAIMVLFFVYSDVGYIDGISGLQACAWVRGV